MIKAALKLITLEMKVFKTKKVLLPINDTYKLTTYKSKRLKQHYVVFFAFLKEVRVNFAFYVSCVMKINI